MGSGKTLVAVLCALLFVVACGKKEEPRGKFVRNVRWSRQLVEKLSSEKGFDPVKNCAQLVERNDGKQVIEIAASKCPADNLAPNVVATLSFVQNRSGRMNRDGQSRTFYLFLNDTPVGLASSDTSLASDRPLLDMAALEESLKADLLIPGTILDLLSIDDLYRAAGELQIAGGVFTGLKTFPAMERLSREEEIMRQLVETKKLLAQMLETQRLQFEMLQKLMKNLDQKVGDESDLIINHIWYSYEQTIDAIERARGSLSEEMKAGFKASRLQVSSLRKMTKLKLKSLAGAIDAQTVALKAQMDLLSTAEDMKDVLCQLSFIEAQLEKTATKDDVDEAVRLVKEDLKTKFDAAKKQLDTLATKTDLDSARRKIMNGLGFQLWKIQEKLKSVSTKKDVSEILKQLSAIKTVVDKAATADKLEALTQQVKAIDTLTKTLATKQDVTDAKNEITGILCEEFAAAREQLGKIIDTQDALSSELKTSVTGINGKLDAIDAIVKKGATKAELDKIAASLKEVQETLQTLATKEDLECFYSALDATLATLATKADVAEMQELINCQLANMEAMIEKLLTKEAFDADMKLIKDTLADAKTELAAIKGKFADVAKAEDVKKQIGKLKRKVSLLATSAQVSAIDKQIKGLKAQIDLVATQESVGDLKTSLECEIAALQWQIESLAKKEDVKALEGPLADAQASLKSLKSSVAALEKRQNLRDLKEAAQRGLDFAQSVVKKVQDYLRPRMPRAED